MSKAKKGYMSLAQALLFEISNNSYIFDSEKKLFDKEVK